MRIAPRRHRIEIRIPKLEIQNKPKHSNLKIEIQNEIICNFMFIYHLDLFRISYFEFRICNFIYTWRALRLCARYLIPDSENFKYLSLESLLTRLFWCREPDSNRHGPCDPRDFKSRVSTKFHHPGIYKINNLRLSPRQLVFHVNTSLTY